MPERAGAPEPAPARQRGRQPSSTYRLQLNPGFGFADAAGLDRYLADLGVTHAYLSPILQAVPGSQHGYDVADHSRVSADLGGEAGFRKLAARFARRGIGLVVDVVPNHMAIPARAYLNRQLWSVLAEGPRSPCAHWFDIDWAAGQGRMLLPFLPRPLRDCLPDLRISPLGELPGQAAAAGKAATGLAAVTGDTPVLCYQDRVLPLRPGTERLPMPGLLAEQHYRLASWRSAAAGLNWRRFFDISSLIALRVEEPDVFAATHGVLLGLVAEGLIDGLRIDHPDGLADPRGYLRRLAAAAGSDTWIVAEKILAAGERLPADWPCGGTTGYDALAVIGGLFTDPAGVPALTAEYAEFAAGPPDFASAAWAARREVARGQLSAEVMRLARLLGRLDEPGLARLRPGDLRAILAELLAACTVYRAYVVPGEAPPAASRAQLGAATAAARRRLPARLHEAADLTGELLLGRGAGASQRPVRDELMIRFGQVSAAVQAKGVEDTASYRWTRLASANEVGADPDRLAYSPAEFHRFAGHLSETWPGSMTTLSTHDTKRQEDVRARLAAIAESPGAWAHEVAAWHARAAALPGAGLPDPPTEYLLWQTLVGAWPIEAGRLTEYVRKAMREAKLSTSWTDPDPRYEDAVIGFARHALTDPEIASRIAEFVALIAADAAVNSLSAKLVQLTMPGVPDVYQGCELTGLSLVDPDNRRPVDFSRRRRLLAGLPGATRPQAGRGDAPWPPAAARPASAEWLDAAKLLVTSQALRLRRAQPGWFGGSYQPLAASGSGHEHVVAFSRASQVVSVATRLPGALRRHGGWRDTALPVPPGRWRDLLTGAEYETGSAATAGRTGDALRLAELTSRLPVALLARATGPAGAGPP